MATKVDGTNGVIQSYDYQVLTTGFSYTFSAGINTLVINPAGTLATGTVTMPAAPADGMVITIDSTQQVTAITVQGNTGQTITGAPSQLIPNQPLSFMYNLANTNWQPFAGGAGRATSIVSGTAVASTSGTSINFTGIPSWVKRITVMFAGVSISGSSNPQIQIGSGSVATTGYASTAMTAASGPSIYSVNSYTAGFVLTASIGAGTIFAGSVTLTLLDSSTNIWVSNGNLSYTNSEYSNVSAGTKTLSGTLDRVRITTVNGTDTFDAGSINILYE